ncbi:MAG: FUSC family protein, partial [Deltaproteobacteria bacterium]|nr:FUSC family protein [Deltaproteobacteria bacterium]
MAEAIHSSVWYRGVRRALSMPPAAAYAIRSGVAVSAAIWIGKAPGLVENQSTWILITVLVLLQPTTGGFLLKGALRAVGTVVAAFTAILLFGLFAQDPPLLMAGLFLVQAIAAYGFTGPRFQYAWFVWAFTTAIVLGGAIAGQGAVETVAFQRASMVGIGILLVLLTDALFWPARAESSLRQSLASRARQLGDALRRSVVTSVDPQGGPSAAPESGLLAKQIPLVAALRTEIGVSRATADGLEHVAMLLATLASRARVLANPVAFPPEMAAAGGDFAAALTELARRIEAALAEVAAALTASRAPTGLSD